VLVLGCRVGAVLDKEPRQIHITPFGCGIHNYFTNCMVDNLARFINTALSLTTLLRDNLARY